MKNQVIIIAITVSLLNVGTKASAQKGWQLGVIVQPQMTMVDGDVFYPGISSFNTGSFNFSSFEKFDRKFTLGFQAGLQLGYHFNDTWSASIAAMYSLQGQKYKDIEEEGVLSIDGVGDFSYDASTNLEISLNYVKVPLLLEYNTSAASGISFMGHVGGYVGYLASYDFNVEGESSVTVNTGGFAPKISGTATSHASGTDYEQSFSSLLASGDTSFTLDKRIFKDLDFGVVIGAGIRVKLSEKLFLPVMLNYEIGLMDIKERSATYSAEGSAESAEFWNFSSNSSDPNPHKGFTTSALSIKTGLQLVL